MIHDEEYKKYIHKLIKTIKANRNIRTIEVPEKFNKEQALRYAASKMDINETCQIRGEIWQKVRVEVPVVGMKRKTVITVSNNVVHGDMITM